MLKKEFLLDPQVIFLNHGSFGACPREVFEVYQDWQRKLERQPVQFLGSDLDGLLKQARAKLAEYLHTQASDLVFIPNATHGVNIVAHSLHLQPGDEILATNHEYGACKYTLQYYCSRSGATYKEGTITLPVTSSEEIVEQLWEGVTAHTKLIFLSHISSPTSLTFPVEAICRRARQAGILTLVDGAHAPGQMPLDLAALPVDFYTGNCHKWMLSPKGAGFLYASQPVQSLIEPLIVSWGYPATWSPPKESQFIDLLQWTGTKDPAAALSVPSAIQFLEDNHWDVVREDCHHLLTKAMEQICSFTGLAPIYPVGSAYYHQMATIPIPPVRTLAELKSHLLVDYRIEIPTIEWNNQHFLRCSVQAYNTQSDIDCLVEALGRLLPQLIA